MLTLYHFADAVCGQKVRIGLSEKNLEWKSIEVELFNPEFMRGYIANINRNGVVPTLDVDGKLMNESNVILEYLDEAYPEPRLTPTDLFERARMRIWMAQIDIDVHVSVNALTFAVAFRPKFLQMTAEQREAHYNTMPDPEKRWRRRDLIDNGTQSRLYDIAVRRFLRLFNDMEARLADHQWLAGDSYSLADAAFTPYINRVDAVGFNRMWAKYPRLNGWFERVKSRKSYEDAFGKWNVPKSQAQWTAFAADAWPVIDKIAKAA